MARTKESTLNSQSSVLWLVTARSGSKSIPNKNIKPLGGRPLLAYRIQSALSFASAADVWISTDCEGYAEIARSFGATVPFMRPPELATDTAKSADVILHAISWAEAHQKKYQAIGVLEPTSPFIFPNQLHEAAQLLSKNHEADGIVAVRQVRPSTYSVQSHDTYLDVLAKRIREQGSTRRQEEPLEITPSGGFYISKWESFKMHKTLYTEKTMPYLVPDICSLEIDEPIDWMWAEFLLEKGYIKAEDLVTFKK